MSNIRNQERAETAAFGTLALILGSTYLKHNLHSVLGVSGNAGWYWPLNLLCGRLSRVL